MTAKKIINTTLIILLAIAVTGVSLYFTQIQKLLTGSILDGATPAYINAIEFVTPNGTTSPINNVVTIEGVFVDFTTAAEGLGFTDGNIYGDDIASSFITFIPCTDESSTCTAPSGVTAEGNQIFTPDTFSQFYVRIYVTGVAKSNATLKVKAVDCSYLATRIMKGAGSGAYSGTDILPLPSHSPDIDFGAITPIQTITFSYPTTTKPGAKTFQIVLDFVPGLTERAVITSSSGTGIYEIDVRDEGADTVATASNLAYVFNDLMQVNSPFTAAFVGGSKIRLTSKELGMHTNSYVYYLNNGSTALSFLGGTTGTGGATGILTTPLTLDNTMTEGDTSLVYAAGSVGAVTWSSSHEDILEVSAIGETEEAAAGTVDFMAKTIDSDYDFGTPSVIPTGCEYTYDETDPTIINGGTCNVEVTLPVTYDAPTNGEAIATFGDNTYTIPVEFSELTGHLNGSATWTVSGDLNINLTGSVTGSVTGTATGDLQGMVYGTVTADVDSAVNIDLSSVPDTVNVPEIISGLNALITAGLDVSSEQLDGDLTSTVKEVGTTVSEYALLTAKRGSSPINTAILTIVDEQGCIASLDTGI